MANPSPDRDDLQVRSPNAAVVAGETRRTGPQLAQPEMGGGLMLNG